MKKLALLATILGMAGSAFAQGAFNFDNSAAYSGAANAITATVGSQGAAGEGAAGAVLGSDATHATPNYDVSFLWQLGTANSGATLSPDAFMTAGASNAPVSGSFAAATGDAVNGGGLYGLGSVIIPGTTDGTLITVQAIAWYDSTGSTSYSAAEAAGHNVGGGPLTTVRLANGSDLTVADMSGVNGIVVNGTVPEPSILALSGIGAAALMLVRRKK